VVSNGPLQFSTWQQGSDTVNSNQIYLHIGQQTVRILRALLEINFLKGGFPAGCSGLLEDPCGKSPVAGSPEKPPFSRIMLDGRLQNIQIRPH
jgi:hypothetical protein